MGVKGPPRSLRETSVQARLSLRGVSPRNPSGSNEASIGFVDTPLLPLRLQRGSTWRLDCLHGAYIVFIEPTGGLLEVPLSIAGPFHVRCQGGYIAFVEPQWILRDNLRGALWSPGRESGLFFLSHPWEPLRFPCLRPDVVQGTPGVAKPRVLEVQRTAPSALPNLCGRPPFTSAMPDKVWATITPLRPRESSHSR